MTINKTIDHVRHISLKHEQVKTFHAGHSWNSATNKGETYPNVWLEMPVLNSYTNAREKRYTFALNVLMLAKQDDFLDVINKQSQCEEILDDILQALQFLFKNNMGYEDITGITLENFNDDLACGARADLTIITNRTCDYKTRFRK